jgi:hypothetical protein
MNASDFQQNERPNEYEVRFRVEGEISVTIKADSLDDARAKAQVMADDEEFGLDLDQAEDVSIARVWKSQPMFLVTRDGKSMQVSRLEDGDLPREPDERGF